MKSGSLCVNPVATVMKVLTFSLDASGKDEATADVTHVYCESPKIQALLHSEVAKDLPQKESTATSKDQHSKFLLYFTSVVTVK